MCVRKGSDVPVMGEGMNSMGRFAQSAYSRGKSAFRCARRANTKEVRAEPISQRLAALTSGWACPGMASASEVETYGVTSGPVSPKCEKSPCGFAHSSGITIPISAGAGLTPARSSCLTTWEIFLNSRASGLSCRSQVVIPQPVS